MDIAKPYSSASWRLLAVLFLLSTVLGAVEWWLEVERIDDRVIAMAAKQTRRFADEHLPSAAAFSQPEGEMRIAVLDHFKDAFPIVELYDASRRKTFEYVASGREYVEDALEARQHGFPHGSEPYYQRIDIGRDAYIQVILPLLKDGKAYGYFEGVYDVPDEAIDDIRENVMRSVMMIMIAVIVTGGVLYPLLIALNRNLLESSRNVLRGNIELLEVLGGAIGHRDSDTHAHNYRVTWYSLALAQAAQLSAEEVRTLIAGAFLHDVGKIGISDNILLKPGILTAEEHSVMRKHVPIGESIISKAKWLGAAREVVQYHHEKWDGSGYPLGLRGLAIPQSARIFAIADVFDALTSRRSYKEPLSLKATMDIIRKSSGQHFEPRLVDLFDGIAGKVYADVCQRSDEELENMLLATVATIYGV